jgi:hypothetical protein
MVTFSIEKARVPLDGEFRREMQGYIHVVLQQDDTLLYRSNKMNVRKDASTPIPTRSL